MPISTGSVPTERLLAASWDLVRPDGRDAHPLPAFFLAGMAVSIWRSRGLSLNLGRCPGSRAVHPRRDDQETHPRASSRSGSSIPSRVAITCWLGGRTSFDPDSR